MTVKLELTYVETQVLLAAVGDCCDSEAARLDPSTADILYLCHLRAMHGVLENIGSDNEEYLIGDR